MTGKCTMWYLMVALATLAAVSCLADSITGNYLELVYDKGAFTSIKFNPLGTGGGTGTQFMGTTSPFSIWSVHLDGTAATSYAGYNLSTTLHDDYSLSAATTLHVGNQWTVTWDGYYPSHTEWAITRTLKFNDLNSNFLMGIKVTNNSPSSLLTDVHFANAWNPDPDGDATATNNTVFTDGSGRHAQAIGPTSGLKVTNEGAGTAGVSTTLVTDPHHWYNGGINFNNGNGDKAIGMGWSPNDIVRGDNAENFVLYDFGTHGEQTPELGTFLLMGLGMFPIAGSAVRRRLRSKKA